MLIQAVETYLAVRRAADFKLDAVERYLCSFAQFATAQGNTRCDPYRDRVGRARRLGTSAP